MKKLFIQIVMCIILGVISFNSIAQQKIDSTTIKIKLLHYQNQIKSSKITTIAGGGLIVVGGIVALVGYNKEGYAGQDMTMVGWYMLGGGIIISGVSALFWNQGKKKVEVYKIRLQDARACLFYAPNHAVGVTLTFKF